MEPTKDELNKIFEQLLKNETKFCEENGYKKNEHGAYVYVSTDGNSSIRLDLVLNSYKEWLIDNDILEEKI